MISVSDLTSFIFEALEIASPKNMVSQTVTDVVGTDLQNGKFKIFALGKASSSMFEGLKETIPSSNISGALIISHMVEEAHKELDGVSYVFGPHPLIDENSEIAGALAQNFFRGIKKDERLLCLISGGGSSMMALPKPPLSLHDKKNVITKVMLQGIPEREVNEIRKQLSEVKAGRLLELLPEIRVDNFFLSDEREHKLQAISSGPTVTGHEGAALEVAKQYNILDLLGSDAFDLIHQNTNQEQVSAQVVNHICGTRNDVLEALHHVFDHSGIFKSISVETIPIHSVGPEKALQCFASKCEKLESRAENGLHVLVVPTEIQIRADVDAKGGRNQHFAALVQSELSFKWPFLFLGFATDGVDYIDGVQGAYCVNSSSLLPFDAKFLKQCIEKTNTNLWHSQQGTLIKGPKTGHNVSDLALFVFEKSEIN